MRSPLRWDASRRSARQHTCEGGAAIARPRAQRGRVPARGDTRACREDQARDVDLVIERLAAGGDGVGRGADGRVVFVPFTAPGDRVRVRITSVRPRFARGRVLELLAPGPARAQPVCTVFGRCGGCAWQHVEYTAQLEAKRAIVEDAIGRIAGLALPGPIAVAASPSPWAWRSRTRVLARGGRVGYRRRSSHALEPVSGCPVLVPALDERLRALATSTPPDGELELAVGDDEPRCAALAGDSAAPAGPRIGLRVGGDRLEISPGVFFQAHAQLRDALRDAALAAAGEGELAADVFAGAGFFTLGLARRFARVIAVEAAPAAAADLRRNAAAAACPNVEVLEASVENARDRLRRAEVLVLDPPRTGLPGGVAESLADGSAARIVYVSCEPSTLARDLAAFAARGYVMTRAAAFDLFPQTPHVEVLVALERARGPSESGRVDSPPEPPARGRA